MRVGRTSTPWGGALSLFLLALRTKTAHSQVGCMSTFNEIALRESLILDTSFERTYILCPFKQFSVGELTIDKEINNGQLMLPLRANMKIQCGDSGSRENGCFVDGGAVQVDGTNLYDAGSNPLENVVLQGITFTQPLQYSARFNRPGNVEFLDCEFRDMDSATVPVLLDYFDSKNPGRELEVTFKNCLFDNIKYGGEPRRPALVVGNSRQNRIVIDSTRFTNNDMVENNSESSRKSYLIESSGPLTIRGSCFENNKVGVSPVAMYHQQYLYDNNYQFLSTGRVCMFSSHFVTAQSFQFFMPTCSTFDVTGLGAMCPMDGTTAPTPAPPPTTSPTTSPSAAPTDGPTVSPAPTLLPTRAPTTGPTKSPTAFPTGSPTTFIPTVSPTAEPTDFENIQKKPLDDPPEGDDPALQKGIDASSGQRVVGFFMSSLLGVLVLLLL